MKEKRGLINKVKRLIRRIGLPRWLHHFGPKTYEFYNHALAYIVKQECKLGYRRVTKLLRSLGLKCPCFSALCTSFNKVPLPLWKRLLAATASMKVNLVAIDGSGMSRPLPSPHYYKRIDKPYPIEIPLKISIAIDTKSKKILAVRLRSKKAHDIRDAKYLISHLPRKPNKIVADKGYDANWLHQYCLEKGIRTCIPVRDYGGKCHPRNTLRRRLAKEIKQKTYGRRNIVEAMFKAIKCKFGASVNSVKFSAQRAEMYCRAIAHNINGHLERLFERSPKQEIYLNTDFLL
jgi:hypothetical protein